MSAAPHPEVDPDPQHDRPVASAGATDLDLKAGRRQVARSRGVLSGLLLLLLGAWAALAPFIAPYFDFGITPRPDDAWVWTSGRGLYEVLPGAVAAVAGLILLLSASRALTVLVAWLAALAGVWLVVAPTLDVLIDVGVGSPAAGTGDNKAVAQSLLYFYGTGAVIALVAGIALGRLSVHSVRDVRAAERRAEAEAAAEARRVENERREHERLEHQRVEQERLEHERREHERREHERLENERLENERRQAVGTEPHDAGSRTATLPAVDRDAPTTEHPAADPAARPDQPAPTGHQINDPAAAPAAPAAPQSTPPPPPPASTPPATAPPTAPNLTPPPAGGTEQYRYPPPETPSR